MTVSELVSLLAPELTLTIGACLVLLMGLSRSESVRSSVGLLAFLTALVAIASAWRIAMPDDGAAGVGLRLTNLAWYVRLVALGVGLVVILVHNRLACDSDPGEVFAMILFSLAGILLVSLADDLVILFLAIELVSIPTYVLVANSRTDVRAQEAGVKYFFLGAMAAALMVYGFSFLYGATGETSLSAMKLAGSPDSYVTLGLLLAFAGLAFKIVAVPFHAYAADVYQGASSPVTGLLGFFPKLAGFVALIKILIVLQPQGATPTGWDIDPIVFAFLWLTAVATMIVGNVLAFMQRNVKRILAYSSISHSGYMLIAVLVGPVSTGGPLRNGLSAMLFYIAAYGLMNLGAFAVLALLHSRQREIEDLDDLAGLSRTRPVAALALAICVFSLMGMPPTAGFLGKVYVFSSALSVGAEHPYHGWMIALAIIGVINAAIAAAYYLRIIAACYLGEPVVQAAIRPRSRALQAGLLVCCIGVLVIGVWPRGLIRMARQPSFDLQPRSTSAQDAVAKSQ